MSDLTEKDFKVPSMNMFTELKERRHDLKCKGRYDNVQQKILEKTQQ